MVTCLFFFFLFLKKLYIFFRKGPLQLSTVGTPRVGGPSSSSVWDTHGILPGSEQKAHFLGLFSTFRFVFYFFFHMEHLQPLRCLMRQERLQQRPKLFFSFPSSALWMFISLPCVGGPAELGF